MYLNLRYLRYIFKIEVQSEVQIEVQDRFYPKVNPENSSVMRMDRNELNEKDDTFRGPPTVQIW